MSKVSLLLLALIFVINANAAVTVTVNTDTRRYDTNPRISEVLQPYALQQPWYWPAATLYRTDSNKPEQLRQRVLQLLNTLGQQTSDLGLRETYASLGTELLSWQLAERVVLAIDYDAARVKPELNPRLDDGEYLLQLKLRPEQVYLTGGIAQSGAVPHKAGAPVKEYLASAKLLNGADSSQLAVVQTNGQVQIAGVSYWNLEQIEAMPGAQLLVLFAPPLLDRLTADSNITQLNTLLQQLAVYRILP